MNVTQLFAAQAQLRPEAPAIIETRRGQSHSLSFAGLERESGRVASVLQKKGLQPGDGVLLLVPMSAELYIVMVALLRLGCVAQFLDPSAGLSHIEECCRLQPPQALIATTRAHVLLLLSPALRRIPLRFCTGRVPGSQSLRAASQDGSTAAIEQCAHDAPALLTFTSGSTGRPKAAVRTHGFLRVQHRLLEKHLQLQPGEMELCTLPLFVLANLASGVTSLLAHADLRRPAAIEPARVWAQMQEHRPTRAAASPAFWERLCEYSEQHNAVMPFVQRVHTGGGPVTPVLLKRLHRLAPQAEVTGVYGSTEAEPVSLCKWNEHTRHYGADDVAAKGLPAGAIVPEIELRILHDRWSTPLGQLTAEQLQGATLPPGVAGEIVVTGEHVLRGYLHGHGNDETKFTVADKVWHRTGDAGYVDEEGRLWLLGRCAARIEDEHGTIYPFAVENAAQQIEGVRRAALLAVDGQRTLVVERRPDAALDVDDLRRALSWAHIARVLVVRRIPLDKRHNSKIDYPALRRLLPRVARTGR